MQVLRLECVKLLFFAHGLWSDTEERTAFLCVLEAKKCHFCVSVISRSSVGGESVKRVVCGGGIGDSRRRNRRWVVEGIAKV